jgi:hypothetical protein
MPSPIEIHILNLGAGVQSTMLYMLAAQHHPAILATMPKIDYAIFADVGEEPAAVYRHLEWLKTIGGPEILVRSTGSRLGDDLIHGTVGRTGRTGRTGRRFATIPAFTANGGMGKRQCTKEYKIDVVERCIRREIVGLKPRQRFPLDKYLIHQYMGLSFDEAKRVLRVQNRFYSIPWSLPHFPLFETNTTRGGAKNWLKPQVPHEVPRSACVFCPYHRNDEWQRIQAGDPSNPDWLRAVEIDEALRSQKYLKEGSTQGNFRENIFLHRSCVPLAQADITIPDPPCEFGFAAECEGMCGL